MKIKFLIGYPANTFATEWKEIKELSKTEPVPDEDTYVLFKALELKKSLAAFNQARVLGFYLDSADSKWNTIGYLISSQ